MGDIQNIENIIDVYNVYTGFLLKVSAYYTDVLYHTKDMLNYVKEKRKLSDITLKQFRIGASCSRENLFKFIEMNGLDSKLLYETGVCSREASFEYMQNRIVFPIEDFKGNVVAFSGREFDINNTYAKYLNTPNTCIFNKSYSLYGISLAKSFIIENDFVLVVEGNMDMISCFQAGLKSVVSTCGTSLTLQQILLLHHYTSHIICCFDADNAGKKASQRAQKLFESLNFSYYSISLSNNPLIKVDPDSFVQSYGVQPILDTIKDILDR